MRNMHVVEQNDRTDGTLDPACRMYPPNLTPPAARSRYLSVVGARRCVGPKTCRFGQIEADVGTGVTRFGVA